MNISEAEVKDFLDNGPWYHTIDFPNGLVSKGVYDHRKFVPMYKIPESLENMDVLDVGCSDGFFSFEMERRGAKSILSVDIDKVSGPSAIAHSLIHKEGLDKKYIERQSQHTRFSNLAQKLGLQISLPILMAIKLLDSKVKFQEHSVYELHKLGRQFDLVFCGDLVEHLKNPIEAVEELSKATKTLAIITIASVATGKRVGPWLSVLNLAPLLKGRVVTYWGDRGGTFFHFSAPAFVRLLKASGFSRVEVVSKFEQRNFKSDIDIPHVVYHAYK